MTTFTAGAQQQTLPIWIFNNLFRPNQAPVVNVVAVLSLSEIAPAAFQQHLTWGALLAALALFGPGRWSLDAWWHPKTPPR